GFCSSGLGFGFTTPGGSSSLSCSSSGSRAGPVSGATGCAAIAGSATSAASVNESPNFFLDMTSLFFRLAGEPAAGIAMTEAIPLRLLQAGRRLRQLHRADAVHQQLVVVGVAARLNHVDFLQLSVGWDPQLQQRLDAGVLAATAHDFLVHLLIDLRG